MVNDLVVVAVILCYLGKLPRQIGAVHCVEKHLKQSDLSIRYLHHLHNTYLLSHVSLMDAAEEACSMAIVL